MRLRQVLPVVQELIELELLMLWNTDTNQTITFKRYASTTYLVHRAFCNPTRPDRAAVAAPTVNVQQDNSNITDARDRCSGDKTISTWRA
jgi:hypothetical protein